MIPLSPATKERVDALFESDQERAEVSRILETECGDNLPMVEPDWTDLAERVRFAVLKLSQGSLPRLRQSLEKAKGDWRDTLMMAGFGHSERAHLAWHPE